MTDTQTEMKDEVAPVLKQAEELTIVTEKDYEKAGGILLSIKALRKKVKQQFGSAVKKAHVAWKAAKEIENTFDNPLKEAESIIKNSISAYTIEINRKIEEEKRMAEEKARQEAEAKREEETKAAFADGNIQEAFAKKAEPVVAAPVAVRSAPKTEGISTRELWSAKVVDIQKLALAVGEGNINPDFILPNMPLLNKYAREVHSSLRIPGVIAESSTSVAGRTTQPADPF